MKPPAALLISAVLLTSCSQEPPPDVSVQPPLPTDMGVFDASIVRQIEAESSAVLKSPRDAALWRELGMLYHAHNRFQLAVECYTQSLVLAPDKGRTHYYLALAQRELGSVPESVAAMRRAAELDSAYAASRWRLGLWLLEDGDLEGARVTVEGVAGPPGDSRALTLVRARVRLQAGEADTAAALLEAYLADHPYDRYAHFLLGDAYRRLGRGENAQRHLGLGRNATPDWSDPWYEAIAAKRAGFQAALSRATELLGSDPPRAVGELERLRTERSGNDTVLINLGIAYRLTGRLRDSIDVLLEAVRRNPDRGLAHFHLSVSYAQQSRVSADSEFLELALEHAAKAIELQPTSARGHALLGELLAQAQRPEAAVDSYFKAVRDPQDTAWLHRLGSLLCQLQRWQEAIPVLTDFIERAPGSPDAHFLLGLAQANTGHFEDAGDNLERALQLRPGDARTRQVLKALERARVEATEK